MVWCYLIREADGRLFCSLSVGNMKLLRGILSFTLLDINQGDANTVEPLVIPTDHPKCKELLVTTKIKTTGVSISRRGPETSTF